MYKTLHRFVPPLMGLSEFEKRRGVVLSPRLQPTHATPCDTFLIQSLCMSAIMSNIVYEMLCTPWRNAINVGEANPTVGCRRPPLHRQSSAHPHTTRSASEQGASTFRGQRHVCSELSGASQAGWRRLLKS